MKNDILKVSVEVKTDGKPVVFDTVLKETDVNLIQLALEHLHNKYKAICKDGATINIEVRYLSEISNTYPLLYSYYGSESRFVIHT